MRRTTRQQSGDSGPHSPARRSPRNSTGPNRFAGSPTETTTGLAARGSPSTSRSTAYGGRDLRPPASLGAYIHRAAPARLLGEAVANSRERSRLLAAQAAQKIPATPTSTHLSSSEGDDTEQSEAAYTDESPLGADEIDGDEDEDEEENVEEDYDSDEQDNIPTPPSDDGSRRNSSASRPQQEKRRNTKFQPIRWLQSSLLRPSVPFDRVTSAVHWLSRNLIHIWKYICIFLFSAFILSAVQQTYVPSISSAIPSIDLSRVTDLFGLVSGQEPRLVMNDTAGGAPIYHGISHWQFDRLASRVGSLESSLTSLSRTVKAKTPLRRVNFFAAGSGVLVDPYLTSPTRPFSFGSDARRAAPRSIWDVIRRRPSSLLPRFGPGPASVFHSWDDAGECWCSPPSEGKSQIAMVLPRAVVPQDLVVEHIPQSATLDDASMPRDLEFWVSITDETTRQRVINAALDSVESTLPSDSASSGSGHASSASELFGTKKSLDESWVRIGRFHFSQNSGESSQTFHLPVDLGALRVPVNRVVIRATSSWGDSGSVCIYRLKLHGLAVEQMPQHVS